MAPHLPPPSAKVVIVAGLSLVAFGGVVAGAVLAIVADRARVARNARRWAS